MYQNQFGVLAPESVRNFRWVDFSQILRPRDQPNPSSLTARVQDLLRRPLQWFRVRRSRPDLREIHESASFTVRIVNLPDRRLEIMIERGRVPFRNENQEIVFPQLSLHRRGRFPGVGARYPKRFAKSKCKSGDYERDCCYGQGSKDVRLWPEHDLSINPLG